MKLLAKKIVLPTLFYVCCLYNIRPVTSSGSLEWPVTSSGSLELTTDEDLLNLIRSESYVAVLFSSENCLECEAYEDALFAIREDLVDSLNAWVVKSINSQLIHNYSPSKEPAVVFFRHGIPLLYEGEPNDDLILHTFLENKEPCVRELNDNNFEHLTQVATGATTGDWFILFYSTDCIPCQNLQARWEAVCAKLKTRLNVARINKQYAGQVTSRRFSVQKVPSFIFFRHGKMYRYNSVQYDIPSLSAYPVTGYMKARIEEVPKPKSPLEDMVLGVLEFFNECSFVFKILTMLIGVSIVVSFAYKLNMKKERKNNQKKHKK